VGVVNQKLFFTNFFSQMKLVNKMLSWAFAIVAVWIGLSILSPIISVAGTVMGWISSVWGWVTYPFRKMFGG